MVAASICLLAAGRARAAADLTAAVVVIDSLPPDGALAAARDQVSARWRLETLHAETAPAQSPTADVETVSRAYLNADFLRCLTLLQSGSLDFDRLLERGRRAEAAQVGTIAAACALGAGDEGRARELVRRLLVRELDQPDNARKTTPQFQRVLEDERQVAQRWGRVTVEVRTEPPGASVHVDGLTRCPSSPCRLNLLRGEHVLLVERLGRRPRTTTTMLDEDQTLTLALDPASAEEVRHQLAIALGTGADPSGADIARAASVAYGVGLLALVWQKGGQVHADVFQRSGGGLTHVAMDAAGPNPAARAVAAALREWKSDTGPRSMLRQPMFWTTAVGVALVSAAAVFYFYRPLEPNHEIVFH
jgi:hypothetical protein